MTLLLRLRFLSFLSAPLLGTALAACGGSTTVTTEGTAPPTPSSSTSAPAPAPSSDGGTKPGTPAPPAPGGYDFCAASAARAKTCGDTPASDCEHWKACYDKALRPGVSEPLQKCITSRACDASDDPCFDDAAKPYVDDPVFASYQTTCTSRQLACEEAGEGFSDDYCAPSMALFPTSTLTTMRACLDQPCASVAACFKTTFQAVGCGK